MKETETLGGPRSLLWEVCGGEYTVWTRASERQEGRRERKEHAEPKKPAGGAGGLGVGEGKREVGLSKQAWKTRLRT